MRTACILGALLLLAGACSSDNTGSEQPTGECVTDDDCSAGTCLNGQCVALPGGGDATLPDVVGGTKDITGADDVQPLPGDAEEDSTPADDLVAEDLPSPPDNGSIKPPTGSPDIGVDPLQHTFTYEPGVDNPETKPVLIYNQGSGSLIISKVEFKEGSSPEFSFTALPPMPKKLLPFEQAVVMILFKEQAPHGPATLLIHSNDPDEGIKEVTFNSQSKVGDQPCIGLSPSSLNYGQVVRGTTKTLSVDVINCSSSLVLQVSDITRSQFFGMPLTDEYHWEPQPVTPMVIGANQVATLNLSYTPGLAGVDSGYFVFHNSDPTQPEAELNVYGVGVPPPLEEIGIHIELEWDTDNSDVDMHLIKPGGQLFDCVTDCYFSNMNPDWGAAGDPIDDPYLDYDDVDGYGPENTNLSEPENGTYKVVMHYYSESYDDWGGGASNATVRVYSYGQLLGTFGPTTLEYTDKTWDVCTIDWPSANVTELGNIYMAPNMPWCLPSW